MPDITNNESAVALKENDLHNAEKSVSALKNKEQNGKNRDEF